MYVQNDDVFDDKHKVVQAEIEMLEDALVHIIEDLQDDEVDELDELDVVQPV